MSTHNLTGKPNITVHALNSVLVHHATNTVYAVFKLRTEGNPQLFAVVETNADETKPLVGKHVPGSCGYHEVIIDQCNSKTLIDRFGIDDDDWVEAYCMLGIHWGDLTRITLGEQP